MSERYRSMIDYIVTCVNDFSGAHQIDAVRGFDYVRNHGGVSFLERNYDVKHAFSVDAKLGLVNDMTRSVSWIDQRAATVCGSFAEGAEVLSEFSEIGFSKSAFRGKALKAGRRAEAAQDASSERAL